MVYGLANCLQKDPSFTMIITLGKSHRVDPVCGHHLVIDFFESLQKSEHQKSRTKMLVNNKQLH